MTDTTRQGLEALRIATRPALVTACGRAALATLAGVALVLAVWKGLPVTASVIAAGGLMTGALRAQGCRQPQIRVSTTER
jgi:hypothetical protein